MVCKNCGSEINVESSFCTNCGCPAEVHTPPAQDAEQLNPIQDYINTAMPQTDEGFNQQYRQAAPSQPQYTPPQPQYMPPQAQYTQSQPQYTPPQPQYAPPQPQYAPPRPQHAPPAGYYPAPQPYPTPPQAAGQAAPSMGKFLGYMCLFLIPCIGWLVGVVLLFVAAFGQGENEAFRNWARAALIFVGIIFILFIFYYVGTEALYWY